jgi:hypothetical protein
LRRREYHHEGTKDTKKGKKKGFLSFLRALRAFVVNAFVSFTLSGRASFNPYWHLAGTARLIKSALP